MRRPLIIAHRGASAYKKENTLEAFKLAQKMGADGVEMDVRQTKDGVLVLHHDRGVKLGRKRVWVDKTTFQKLKKITRGEITRLEEVIQKLQTGKLAKLQTVFLLDLKQEGMEEGIVKLLKKYKVKKVFVSSTNLSILESFRRYFPKGRLILSYHPQDKWDLTNYRLARGIVLFVHYLLKPFLFRLIKRKTTKGIEIASLHWRLANNNVVDFLHGEKMKVFVWDADKKEQMEKLVKVGVEGIITKRPDVAKGIL